MTKGAPNAGPAQGVASEAARSPEGQPDPTSAPNEPAQPEPKVCVDCGSDKVIYRTEDPAAESKMYCANCKPANVTDEMVEAQGRT